MGMAVRRSERVNAARGSHARQLWFEALEDRRLLSLTHLYTFNDGLANDWIGSAHADLFNGAAVSGGQLLLANAGVTSGQTWTVQYARLPANVLGSGDATVETWFTTNSPASMSTVFDVGNQSGGTADSYLSLTPFSSIGDSRGALRPSGSSERVATGM